MPETVILVHGVLMPGGELRLLAHRLRQRGFDPVIFRYPSRRRDLRRNAEALARFAATRKGTAMHFVGQCKEKLLFFHSSLFDLFLKISVSICIIYTCNQSAYCMWLKYFLKHLFLTLQTQPFTVP